MKYFKVKLRFSTSNSKLVCACMCMCAQSCSTLCDPMECSLPGFSAHGILQARILEWVAISFSRGLHLLHWQVDSLPLSHLGSPS